MEQAILQRLAERAPGKTDCPSEAARAVARDNWRELMPAAREAAWFLADKGCVVVLQRGARVEREGARGPIRIALTEPSSDRWSSVSPCPT